MEVTPQEPPEEPPEPETTAVLEPGTLDAAVLSALWLVRRSFWTLIWVGAIAVVLSGRFDEPGALETPTITSVSDAREVITSPQVFLLLAPAARLGSGWLALLATYPMARRLQRRADRTRGRTARHPGVWSDRWYLMRALRSWRWTSQVRRIARGRLGRAGPPILVLDITLLVTGFALFPVLLVTLAASLD